LIKY